MVKTILVIIRNMFLLFQEIEIDPDFSPPPEDIGGYLVRLRLEPVLVSIEALRAGVNHTISGS